MDPFLPGLIASILAGACTSIGALLALGIRHRINDAIEDGLLSLAAGVMLSASIFSLLIPGLHAADAMGFSSFWGTTYVIGGILTGMILLTAIHKLLPHDHFIQGHQGPNVHRIRQVWLFIIAITIHNIPEGMSVGIGFGDGTSSQSYPLAFGIGLQNIPEGFAVSAALIAIGYRRRVAFGVSALTGILEGLGGLLGATLSTFFHYLMPGILGLAAGAMLFIISDEIIPETHKRGNQTLATWALMFGFCMMMYLDVIFG